jgi:hypothetical protein
MKISKEFIDKMALGRNLQSCVTHSVILAKAIQELQIAVDEIKLAIGLPRGDDEKK